MRGQSIITIEAAQEGTAHILQVNAVDTATWEPGRYSYSLRASKGFEVVEVEADSMTVLPDLASQGEGFDGRSHLERVLDAIEAVIERRATLDQERYRINNRELHRTPIPELLVLRDRYKAEIRRMKAAKSGNLFNQAVRVSFR